MTDTNLDRAAQMAGTMPVTQDDREAAECLAHQICGCADTRQRRGDMKALLAYREQADLAGYERGQRETVERIVAWIRTGAMFAYTDQEMADAIEAGEWK